MHKFSTKRFAPGYSNQQIEAVVDKYESIAPRLDDNIGNTGNVLPPKEVMSYINNHDTMMRNVFPPVRSCRGKQLKMESQTKLSFF